MPYVSRDKEGNITAIFKQSNPTATEEISATSPAVIEFLFGDELGKSAPSNDQFVPDLYEISLSDLGMVRVIEDLINVLIDKRIIAITDLPEGAIRRLRSRKTIRSRLETISRILTQNSN